MDTFKEISNDEMLNVDGGMGLLAAVGIGAVVLVGGTALGLGTAYVVLKM